MKEPEYLKVPKGIKIFYGDDFATLFAFLDYKDDYFRKNKSVEYALKEGYFYQTQYDVLIDTGISAKRQNRVFKEMESMGLISRKIGCQDNSNKSIRYLKLHPKKMKELNAEANTNLLEARLKKWNRNLSNFNREQFIKQYNLMKEKELNELINDVSPQETDKLKTQSIENQDSAKSSPEGITTKKELTNKDNNIKDTFLNYSGEDYANDFLKDFTV